MTSSAIRKLRYLSTDDIKPDPRNPRRHTREQIRAIAKSIETFGFNAPILINRQTRIIAGHARLDAAKLLHLEKLPTICLDNLSEQQVKAYLIADNRLTDMSSWDDQLLAVHLKELSELALDFEVEATGFDAAEIDIRIQSLGVPGEQPEPDAADEFEFIRGSATSRPGDLWLLGDHRIYCGSALDPKAYTGLLGDEKAAAVFADPPYNVKIDGHVSGLGKVKHREFAMASGEMATDEFTRFLGDAFKCSQAHLEPGALVYACMDWRHIGEMLAAGEACAFEMLNLCIWVKTNGGMGSLYRSKHELVFVFRNGNSSHRNNVQLGRFGRNRTNVWTYPGANNAAQEASEKLLALHPTVKPIALVADALMDCTRRKDIVLDPFLGSGTTILAAERTGRRGRGVELDSLYVDIAVARWQATTGKEARHSSGALFRQLQDERGASR